MINHNQYQIVYGYKLLKKTAQLTFKTKAERDDWIIKTKGDMAIALIDVELEFDNNYQLIANNTTVYSLTQDNK